MAVNWEGIRLGTAVLAGAFALVYGVLTNNPAMMTVGGGLIGFSPAAKGP
jgi:hypothetical protein